MDRYLIKNCYGPQATDSFPRSIVSYQHGEGSFVERVEKERKEPQSWVYEVSLEAISEETSIAMGITRDKLYSTTRDREGARGRGIVGYLARRVSG